MTPVSKGEALLEERFAEFVDTLAADPKRQGDLTDLLREDHPQYSQRGAAALVRMRGWVLLALGRTVLPDSALASVLDEISNGFDPYLVAAAAIALRSYSQPNSAFAHLLMQAIANISNRDEPICFDRYGEYAVATTGTSPVRELIRTLEWLGPAARVVLPDIRALHNQFVNFSNRLLPDLDRAIATIDNTRPAGDVACCELPDALRGIFFWAGKSRQSGPPIRDVLLEDQQGEGVTFGEFFTGRPSIVVFFYTRCDNPLKCSLTITKLGRIQRLLAERGLAGKINTAAITYDPAFDSPARLHQYGVRRGLELTPCQRVFRAPDGISALRDHFRLGVNFVESVVNRHRIEAYVLDSNAHIVYSFELLAWEESQVLDRAVAVLEAGSRPMPRTISPVVGILASVGWALFPKCALCWAAYLGVFSLIGWQVTPYLPWLQGLFATALAINLLVAWKSVRVAGSKSGACLLTVGFFAIVLSKLGWPQAAPWGIALTLGGSLLTMFVLKLTRPSSASRRPTSPARFPHRESAFPPP